MLLTLFLALTSLTIQTPKEQVPLEVKIAYTKQEKHKGLQNKDVIDPNFGMLFVFDKEGYYPFWMKDTSIPLALIFVDKEGVIVDILYGTPYSEEIIRGEKPYQYVLEVNLSFVQKNNIRVDQKIEKLANPNFFSENKKES